jgi:hypothetical protein
LPGGGRWASGWKGAAAGVREETGLEIDIGAWSDSKRTSCTDPRDFAFHALMFFYLCRPALSAGCRRSD